MGILVLACPSLSACAGWWWTRYEAIKAITATAKTASDGKFQVLLVGDSITQTWPGNGASSWNQFATAGMNALNYGVEYDTTRETIFRLQNDPSLKELPLVKLAIILIGTNNWMHSVPDTVRGIEAVADNVRVTLPQASILLLSVLPRNDSQAMFDKVRF